VYVTVRYRPKKQRNPAARIGRNARVLRREKSNVLDTTRLNEARNDSSSCAPPLTAAMSIILLTYDFMSPHDLYSAVFVTLPVYKTSCTHDVSS